jgi:hypothetical protein
MKAFADLSALVQVGTRNGAVKSSGHLDDLGAGLNEKSALAEAALLGLMNRVGRHPQTTVPLDQAPMESQGIAFKAAAPLLEAIDRKQTEIVLEWASAAGQKGMIAPNVVLNRLLVLLPRHLDVIVPVLGSKGKWLADLQGIALEGKGATSEEEFKADPFAYRAKLAETYEELDWQERVKALEALKQSPGGEDLAILEKGLVDRRQEVRHVAAELLSDLRQSQFSQELLGIAQPLLKIEKSLLRRKLGVYPPEANSVPKSIQGGSRLVTNLGPRAQALYDIVRFVRPDHWDATLESNPEQLVELATNTDYSEALTAAWLDAAIRFRSQKWLDHFFILSFDTKHHFVQSSVSQLAALTTQATYEEVVGQRFRRQKGQTDHYLYTSLLYSRRFSPAFSAVVVNAMRGGSYNASHYGFLGNRLDVSVLPMLQQDWGDDPDAVMLRAAWLETVSLRRRLFDSLES